MNVTMTMIMTAYMTSLDDCQYGFIGWNQSNTSLDHDSDGCNDIEDDLDDDNDGILDIDDNCPTGVLDWTVDNYD